MCDAVAIDILLFMISVVTLALIESNPRDQLTDRISPFGMISLLIIGGGLLGFTSCEPLVIPGLQVSYHINPLLGRKGTMVVSKIFLNLFLHYCGKVVLNILAYGILLVYHVTGVPVEFVVLLVLPSLRR